jgi:transcriptional regulator with XRE-family HTH domain
MGLADIFLGIVTLIGDQTDMLTTGNQLRAARALAGLSQAQLAAAAGINVTTISAMEGKGAAVLGSGLDTIKAVMEALDAAGVEILNHGQPGCRLKAEGVRRGSK